MAIVSVPVPYAGKWYFESLLRGLRAGAAAHGHELEVWVEPPGPAARQHVAARLEAQLARPEYVGAVAVHFRLQGEQVERVTRPGKPVVLIGGRSDGLPTVRLDDAAIARDATQHLIDLGHRQIAHLAGLVTAPDDITIRADRVRGYSEAMSAAGLEMQAAVRASSFELADATAAAMSLLSGDDRPTAVFAVVDEVAYGVLEAARRLGLAVPRDVSVIGVDDHEAAAAAGLTTMRQDPAAVGRAAAARLLGETADDDQVVPAELVLRTSTAPPRNGSGGRDRPGLLGRLLRRVAVERSTART
ncbi:LacI family DNA-binding transcriptional regulator [Amnibacterium setariae]|uniref:LacI family transcriptional regulator n=1 Tax=Amnibacterium setariae TaxID=2306585 RepID=A0A3A1UAW8_9MICO|nr:substrate-binding domain-containing protein [Amnibacterium setariae]RIX30476.1 LacI family transcriptional regulator [Amnibacterium setariae]